MSRPRRASARRRTAAPLALLLGGIVLAAAVATVLATRSAPRSLQPTSVLPTGAAAASAAPQRFLLVLDFLAYTGEALATDPIAGSPDAEELIPLIGDPTAFGVAVTDLAGADPDASSRCGTVEPVKVGALAAAMNARLPADQQIDPLRPESRALLHWDAAEGFLRVRLFAQANGSPTCADTGTRF